MNKMILLLIVLCLSITSNYAAQQGNIYIDNQPCASFQRSIGYNAPLPDGYPYYPIGIITFRGDNFRRNAAFGVANVENEALSVLWEAPVSSFPAENGEALSGIGWPGQPVIVHWTKEVREGMNLYEEKKERIALSEVIFAAQDGKIYFLDLRDGTPTRDPISVGWPMRSGVSVDVCDRPLLAVGQSACRLENGEACPAGLRLFNLISGEEIFFLSGQQYAGQAQPSESGAFDGSPLFLFDGQEGVDAMVAAGEDGLLYTVDLNGKFHYPISMAPDIAMSLSILPEVTCLRTAAVQGQGGTPGSVAMFGKYIFMGDSSGVVRCVNSDTMTDLWSADCGGSVDAAPALDLDEAGALGLYIGNACQTTASIRRLSALTGDEIWRYEIPCGADESRLSGCKASPVIGQNAISDLVVFTVNQVEGGSRVIALDKSTGQAVWEHALAEEAISSPVAVYNENSEAWILQGDDGGNLTMLAGRTGEKRFSINLGGPIQGSPAVYKNYLVVGTCGKAYASVYCVSIE